MSEPSIHFNQSSFTRTPFTSILLGEMDSIAIQSRLSLSLRIALIPSMLPHLFINASHPRRKRRARDGTFEAQFLTSETHHVAVENLPNVSGYSTSDLFKPHPSIPNLWKMLPQGTLLILKTTTSQSPFLSPSTAELEARSTLLVLGWVLIRLPPSLKESDSSTLPKSNAQSPLERLLSKAPIYDLEDVALTVVVVDCCHCFTEAPSPAKDTSWRSATFPGHPIHSIFLPTFFNALFKHEQHNACPQGAKNGEKRQGRRFMHTDRARFGNSYFEGVGMGVAWKMQDGSPHGAVRRREAHPCLEIHRKTKNLTHCKARSGDDGAIRRVTGEIGQAEDVVDL
ncbi:hypothetical protein BT96DRAFT_1003232 [Gymnopus androsaceus JB14]|uniref:Uncharacterized protein n=1 Tax=Gymnopus androsaceus JB14 TaxID=1447944 RepID=A0A6A4GUH9_9AGAR|nr:hypothetical protein BT96DRAFT_1003232 [Gymnopus androsaceus JB14]